MKRYMKVTAMVLVSIVFTACSSNEMEEESDMQSSESDHEHAGDNDCSDVHWSHQAGSDGPENWKNLCGSFSDCGGKVQSPVNIVTQNMSEGAELSAPQFNYGKSGVNIINNGHTVQFDVSGDNTVTLNGKEYALLQFHYHALSEHTIDGKSYPIEVHFVHKHSDSDFAVLGIMYEEGEVNDFFTKHLGNFPVEKGAFESTDTIDVLSLFPENTSYYRYDGSLTTPPCSEVVNWYVLKTPITASKEQIETFSKILNGNFRPVQPLNDREILSFEE